MDQTIKRDNPVERAARLMNKSAQFVREGLKRGSYQLAMLYKDQMGDGVITLVQNFLRTIQEKI